MSAIAERFEAGRRLWDDPKVLEALRKTMIAELKRRGIDDLDAFLREDELPTRPEDFKP